MQKHKKKIIYITGGQRSGKSSTAQNLALTKTSKPVFIATAVVTDDEMQKRIARHINERGNQWINIEEPLFVGDIDIKSKSVVVLDCVTLWLSSIFFKHNESVKDSLVFFQNQWNKFISKDLEIIVVSNEIGMGLHANTKMGRKFTDLQGWANQIIAKDADEVFFMVSGIKLKIK